MKKFRHLFLLVAAMLFSSMAINAQGPIDPTLNLALGKTADATSGNAAAAVDGQKNGTGGYMYTSRWESASSDPQYFYVDLGEAYVINKVKMAWEGAYTKHYKLQVALTLPEDPFGSEGWTDVFEQTENPYSGGEYATVDSFEAVAAQFVRIECLERGTGYGNSFFEFEVYGIAKYDASGSDDLTYLTVSPAVAEMSVGDVLQLEAYPITGKGFLAENVTLAWSSTGGATDVDAVTGLYSPTVGGEQTVTCTATPSAGATVTADATITVNAPRELASIVINFLNPAYGLNEVATYTIQTFDQYGDAIVADLNFDSPQGTVDPVAKTYTPNEKGNHTITVSGGNNISTVANLTIVDASVTPTDFTATSSSADTDPSTFPASNAVDGSVQTRWKTADAPAATPVELVVDLGTTYDLSMIAIVWEGANAKNYTVEVASSEAGPYTVVGGESLNDGFFAHTYQLVFPEVGVQANTGVQFIKVNCTEASSGYGYSIYELQVYGVSGTVGINNNTVDGLNAYCVNKTLNIQGNDVVSTNVYSLQGKLVLSASNTNTVDVSSLANGLYVVNVKDVNGNSKAVKVQVK